MLNTTKAGVKVKVKLFTFIMMVLHSSYTGISKGFRNLLIKEIFFSKIVSVIFTRLQQQFVL